MTDTSTNDDLTIARAREALDHVKMDGPWQTWVTIGYGLRVCRARALDSSHSNDMSTRRAKDAIAGELHRTTLDRLDKAVRSDLLVLMDMLPAVEAWRATLSSSQREGWSHPRTVLRHYRRLTEVKEEKPVINGTSYKREAARLEAENAVLQQRLKVEGGSVVNLDDRPEEIGRVIAAHVGVGKARAIAKAITEFATAKAKRAGAHIG